MLTFQVEYGHVVDCGCYRTAPCAYCSWLFFKLLPMLQQLSDKQIFSLTELVRACNHAPTILSYDCSLNFDFTVTGVIYKMLVVFSQSVTSDLTIVFAQWRTVCANYPLTTNQSKTTPIYFQFILLVRFSYPNHLKSVQSLKLFLRSIPVLELVLKYAYYSKPFFKIILWIKTSF